MGKSFYPVQQALWLHRGDYYRLLLPQIRQAVYRVHAVIFIVDAFFDERGQIRRLLDELAYAHWRGVDVKMVVGSSAKTIEIDILGRSSFKYLQEKGVPVKYAAPPDDYSLHSKYVLIDQDWVAVGSHNWSRHIFLSFEDSVAVWSEATVVRFSQEFFELWQSGLEALP